MRKWVGAALGAALLVGATPAFAVVTANLDLTDRPGLSGYIGQSQTFQVTIGGETVNATATAWTWTGTTNSISKSAVLGVWDKGLGVETRDSRGRVASSDNHTNGHTIDNKGSYDFVVFQFDQVVEINSATLTAFKIGSSTDLDLSVGIGNTNVAWNSILGVSDIAALLGTRTDIDRNSTTNNGGTYTIDINPNNLQGNLLFVGASFKSSDRDDGFKIGKLNLSTLPPAPPAVPEPATWAMMIAGFGLVGAAMRRRRVIDPVTA